MAEIKIEENLYSYESNKNKKYDYKTYLKKLLDIINDKQYDYDENKDLFEQAFKKAIMLGPERNRKEIERKILMLYMINNNIIRKLKNIIANNDEEDNDEEDNDEEDNDEEDNDGEDNYGEDNYGKDNYGKGILYNDERYKFKTPLEDLRNDPYYDTLPEIFKNFFNGGSRRNKAKPKAKPKHEDMTMKDIKEMCKANQIKLSKVVDNKRVVFKKKELITKLKRKKIL
jgi:hypothetical protein